MNDALEILNDLEEHIFAYEAGDHLVPTEIIKQFIDQKRSEFATPTGDCCG